ncbi:MAG: hypothetical protein KTR15_11215 [Phycisphaeraceae bacterium]|nr:hypothetical protein [Phycisphaeraceae bacterium]
MINPYTFGMDSSSRPTTSSTPSGAADASDLRYLEDRVDRLSLICMAMWSLLQDKTKLTEEDLMERVKMLDLMDGKEDGKATKTVSKCSRCERPMNARHKKCIYCGHAKLISSAFDAL